LRVASWHWLSKSVRPLPDKWYGLKDQELRLRQREVDFLFNRKAEEIIRLRSKIIGWLRQRLQRDGFLEVETPILQSLAGGAAAMPFKTHHNALGRDLYLRIAPELYLKRLLVSGFEMVFEIGRNFRNEGVDREHNPEFTMCELYWCLADYEDLMIYTEKILGQLVASLKLSQEETGMGEVIEWLKPWKKIQFAELFKEKTGVDVLTDKNIKIYEDVFKRHDLALPQIKTYAKLVDELYKELIRPTLRQPTLLYDYPIELAPLAKAAVSNPGIAEKFQLVAGGMEIVNAYTELNDPVEQRKRFEQQQAEREQGDEEAAVLDEDYLRAMEYGMPPAGGLGLGIDRLVALITSAPNIRETIAFPLLKPHHD
jgi:lysyl-tRNA synthetase, class II